jgi:hypothetical protein
MSFKAVQCQSVSEQYMMQNVPDINAENWRVSTIVQNSENCLYKYGSRNVSLMK